MFVGLVTSLFLAQSGAPTPAPTVSAVVSRNTGANPAAVSKLLARLRAGLAEGGVPVLGDVETTSRLARLGQKSALFCDARRACLVELAQQLPVEVLVSVSVSYVKPDLAVVGEAVRASDGQLLAEFSQVLDKNEPPTALVLGPFVQELRAALAPAPVVLPPPSPGIELKPVTPPAADVPTLALTADPAPRRSVVPAAVSGVAAVAALGGGVAFAVSAANTGAPLRAAPGTPPALSYNEAVERRDAANTQLGVAAGFAVGAVVLGVVTLLLWPAEPTP